MAADTGDDPQERRDDPPPPTAPRGWLAAARRRWPLLVGGACGLTLLIGLLWIVITGLVAHARLQDVQRELGAARASLSAGNTTQADRIVDQLQTSAASAHALTSGPAWWVAGNLPYLGDPVRTARVIATQSDVLGRDVLPGVVRLAVDVVDGPRGHAAQGTDAPASTLDVNRLAQAGPLLDDASAAAARARAAIDATPASWLGPVSAGRRTALQELTTVGGQLQAADRGVRLAVPMLGGAGPRRYFIGFLNEAEARGLGGIPGAFAIVSVDHGNVRVEHVGSDDELQHVRADVELGAQFDARYRQDDPAGTIQNSDISPDFRFAAQIWAGMWQAKTGQHVDGALAIDPTALSYLLRGRGQVPIGGTATVSADDIVALTQQRQYALYPGTSDRATRQRKAFLISIAKAVTTRLTADLDLGQVVPALSQAAAERRLVLWSARAAEERDIVAAGYGGTLEPVSGHPFTGASVVNAAGSKLDYYLDRSLDYRRANCGANSTSTATITLTNHAPRSGLPPYVTIRADKPKQSVHPGDNYLLVTYYGTPGAQVRSVTLDGKPVAAARGVENGLTAVTVGIELPAQRTRTLRVTLSEPMANGSPTVFAQPGIHPLHSKIVAPSCH